jgi:hypothetical protein
MKNSYRRTQLKTLLHLRRDLFDSAFEVAARDPRDETLKGRLEALEHLDALIETHARVRKRRARALLLLAFACVALLVFVGNANHLATATVDLETTSSQLTVTVPTSQRLTDLIAARELTMTGLASVQGPAELGFGAPTSQLRLAGSLQDPIVMEPIDLPAMTVASIQTTGEAEGCRLTLELKEPMRLAFTLSGKVRAMMDGPNRDRTAKLAKPRNVEARWNAGGFVTLVFSSQQTTLTRPLAINALEFVRDEIIASRQLSTSTLTGGQLRFPGLTRVPVTIERGQRLTLTGIDGILRAVTVKKEKFSASYRGLATTADLGDGAGRRNQLPTLLDVATQRTQWVTLVSTLVMAISSVLAVTNWWRSAA